MKLVVFEPPDETQKRCYDCGHLRAYVNLWCGNKEAIVYRGTSIPGVRNCPFWKPAIYRPRLPRESLWAKIWRWGQWAWHVFFFWSK